MVFEEKRFSFRQTTMQVSHASLFWTYLIMWKICSLIYKLVLNWTLLITNVLRSEKTRFPWQNGKWNCEKIWRLKDIKLCWPKTESLNKIFTFLVYEWNEIQNIALECNIKRSKLGVNRKNERTTIFWTFFHPHNQT